MYHWGLRGFRGTTVSGLLNALGWSICMSYTLNDFAISFDMIWLAASLNVFGNFDSSGSFYTNQVTASDLILLDFYVALRFLR